MRTYLEHANITVQNLDETVKFLQTALPDYKLRGEGFGTGGRRWVHVGTDETYLAINESNIPGKIRKDYDSVGFNHFGFVVDDVEALAERLLEAGYERSYPQQNQRFRIRDYFLDASGTEYEFVQYLSEKPEEKNDYSE